MGRECPAPFHNGSTCGFTSVSSIYDDKSPAKQPIKPPLMVHSNIFQPSAAASCWDQNQWKLHSRQRLDVSPDVALHTLSSGTTHDPGAWQLKPARQTDRGNLKVTVLSGVHMLRGIKCSFPQQPFVMQGFFTIVGKQLHHPANWRDLKPSRWYGI